jgi:hypothetical protein
VKKEYLIDLIHRVRALTGVSEPVIVGSQSLYAATEDVPVMVKDCIECDFLLATARIEAMRIVNQELGILSDFSRANGYFADGLGLATVVLVPGWEQRLQAFKDQQDNSNSQLGSGGRHFSFFLLPFSFLPRRFPAATREAAPKNEAGKGKNEEFQLRLRMAGKTM